MNQGVWLDGLQHHERIDGSGYPMRVKGEKIHPYAKIVAIADIYHAMTSNRNYRKAESPYLVSRRTAFRILRKARAALRADIHRDERRNSTMAYSLS